MLNSTLSILLENWPTAVLLCLTVYLIRNRFHKGLHRYPGPVLASLTDCWRFFDVLGRRPDITQIRLHREHGDIVRLGPNTLSFANPQALKTIYGLNKGLAKVRVHTSPRSRWSAESRSRISIQCNKLYQTASGCLLYSRPPIISTMRICGVAWTVLFLWAHLFNMNRRWTSWQKISWIKPKLCSHQRTQSAILRLQFLAFDVIGQITYSKSHGFVDRGEDVGGMVRYLGNLFSYVAPVCIFLLRDC